MRQCFVLCSAIEVSDTAWKQAQLSLRFGGLDHRSLSCHAAAALFASLFSSGLGQSNNHHLQQAVIAYNCKVSSYHAITAESALASPTLSESCPARLMRINSNPCWEHPAQVGTPLAISMSFLKPSILAVIYSRPNITLVRTIARAILAREFLPS